MSIDKFGRSSRTSKKPPRGPKGEGYNLTPAGDYDIGSKRLINVGDSVGDSDCVNLKTLMIHKGEMVRYVNKIIPTRNDLQKAYSVHKYRIKDVDTPTDEGDAVNLATLEAKANRCLKLNVEGTVYNAMGIRINNVGVAQNPDDCVTKQFVEDVVPQKTISYWSFGKRRLADVSEPIDEQDVVTKHYIMTTCLRQTDGDEWNSNNKRIKLVSEPKDLGDAVNKGYMDRAMENTVGKEYMDSVLVKKANKEYVDAYYTPISAMLAKHTSDITRINERIAQIERNTFENKKHHEKQMRKLGVYIFNYISWRSRGRAAVTPRPPIAPEGGDYLNWEDLFKLPEDPRSV